MPTPVVIRRALLADLPAICVIDFKAFSPFGTGEALEIFAKRLAVHRDGLLVAEQAGAVIAYTCCERWTADREPAPDQDSALAHDPAFVLGDNQSEPSSRLWFSQSADDALLLTQICPQVKQGVKWKMRTYVLALRRYPMSQSVWHKQDIENVLRGVEITCQHMAAQAPSAESDSFRRGFLAALAAAAVCFGIKVDDSALRSQQLLSSSWPVQPVHLPEPTDRS